MRTSKSRGLVMLVSLVAVSSALLLCVGCSTDPPLRTGSMQPMDNKNKPAGKPQQGAQMAPQGGAGSVTQ